MGFKTVFKDVLDVVEKFLLPTAAVAVSNIPGIPDVAANVIKNIAPVMSAAEAILPQSNGATKQTAVLAFAKAICDGVDATVTGGAKDTFTKIEPVITAAVNNAIGMVNDSAGKAANVNPTSAPSPAPAPGS